MVLNLSGQACFDNGCCETYLIRHGLEINYANYIWLGI